ncbi:hypothetical protein [Hydrogenobaculum acidophilum]
MNTVKVERKIKIDHKLWNIVENIKKSNNFKSDSEALESILEEYQFLKSTIKEIENALAQEKQKTTNLLSELIEYQQRYKECNAMYQKMIQDLSNGIEKINKLPKSLTQLIEDKENEAIEVFIKTFDGKLIAAVAVFIVVSLIIISLMK